MKNAKRLTLVRHIRGMRLWDLIIGPSGIDLQLGKRRRHPPFEGVEGEISLWIRTHVQICVGNKIMLKSRFPQKSEEIVRFRKYLDNKNVVRAEVITPGNILRITVSRYTTLFAIPGSKRSKLSWNLYDNRQRNPVGILVYKRAVDVVQ